MIRDTDADWDIIAKHEPFFGVLADDRFRRDNLTPAAQDEFYETGRRDIEHVARVLASLNGNVFAPTSAIDFGCGVGRLTFAMTEYANRVVGVDVAAGMREIAEREATAREIAGIELRADLPVTPVDWVNSLIVFQHIPPERGYLVLEELIALLAPGGFFSVQLTFFRDKRHTPEIARDLADFRYDGSRVELLSVEDSEHGSMSMYDYDLNRVMRLLYVAGINPVTAQHTDHGGCHGAWLFGVKRA